MPNVRFYIEATLSVHGEIILHLCPRYLEMIFFFTRMGPSVPKIFRDDFFTRMGPSVPEILRGDVSPKWDHLCPKRKILHRGNS